jgi:hypothetical protein
MTDVESKIYKELDVERFFSMLGILLTEEYGVEIKFTLEDKEQSKTA